MQRYSSVATNAAGAVVSNATITVVLASDGVTLAPLFSDNLVTPTPMANPFTTDSSGVFNFYAANGRYSIRRSGGTIVSPITVGDQLLYDPLGEVNGVLPYQWIDIRAYGAKCDGVTDDTAAFRAALNAIVSPSGGTLLLPADCTILISNFLSIASPNVTIRGGGRSTIIQSTVGNTNIFQTNSYAGTTFQDFDITCNASWVSGFVFNTAGGDDDLQIKNVHVTNFGEVVNLGTVNRFLMDKCSLTAPAGGGTALTFSASPYWTIRDSYIFDFDQVLNCTNSSEEGTMDNVAITASAAGTGTAFHIDTCRNLWFNRVQVFGPNQFGYGFNGNNSHQMHISELDWVLGASPLLGDVINLFNCAHFHLRDSHLYSLALNVSAVNAVEINTCDYAVFSNVHGNGGTSFLGVTSCDWLTVVDCSWTLSASNVMVITDDSTDWKILGCHFINNGQGVSIQPNCPNGEACNNTFAGSTGTFGVGIELFGAQYCKIDGNWVYGNHTDGIHLENSDGSTFTDFNQISNNYCYNNGQDGIFSQNMGMGSFIANACYSNGRHGISVNSETDVDLKQNACFNNGQTDSTGAGIAISGVARPSIVGNTTTRLARTGITTGNQKYGIVIDSGCSGGLIDSNVCHGNVTANLSNSGSSMLVGNNQTA